VIDVVLQTFCKRSNSRACRGKHLALLVRFSNPGRAVDDVDIFTHSNDTLASLRRQILRRIKASGANVKMDLFINGELLDAVDDRKQLSQIPLRDKMVSSLCTVQLFVGTTFIRPECKSCVWNMWAKGRVTCDLDACKLHF
jgi:hypothetical protein